MAFIPSSGGAGKRFCILFVQRHRAKLSRDIDLQAFLSESKIASAAPDLSRAISGLRSSVASLFDELQLQDYIKSTG
jgi:hypothetical protein